MTHVTELPAVTAVITMRVQDFDGWRTKFEATAHLRKEAGFLAHHLCRSAADPSVVYLILHASDRARADRFLNDPALTERARSAGATDATSYFVVPQERNILKGGGPRAAAIVSHDVEDYDRWKSAFDAGAQVRLRATIVGHSVNRSATEPNKVVSFFQADSAESLKALLQSDDLRAAMKKAGVTSGPEVTLLTDTGHGASYVS
jgi:quinol monooxygenase YgiN